jgi:hypothetical protein
MLDVSQSISLTSSIWHLTSALSSSSLPGIEGPVVRERRFDIDIEVQVIAHDAAQIINLFLFVAAQEFAASFIRR